MKRALKGVMIGLWTFLWVALLAGSARAGETFETNWNKLRQAQPPGLALDLKLPRTTFAQGEIISATLTFGNLSTNRYCVWTGTYDRSGRIQDISFEAESETGQPVPDPLARYYDAFPRIGGGLGDTEDLKQWSITLAANQWLQFDAPGIYRVYARSSRPTAVNANISSSNAHSEVVSDIVTIRITPLEADRERQILNEAGKGLSEGGEVAIQAGETLRYLQTPAARRALLPLLSKAGSMTAAFGLMVAPDPKAEARAVLEMARQPDYAVNGDVIWLYGMLQALATPRSNDRSSDYAQCEKAAAQARGEFTTAVTSALAEKQGDALVSTVLALLYEAPRNAALRERLIAHQQNLSRPQLAEIIGRWEQYGGDDFLPIIRMAARPPQADAEALRLLAKLAPDEAQPLIIEDLTRDHPLYIGPRGQSAAYPYEAFPDRELPELDKVLRDKLRKESDLSAVMPLVARCATANLLAEVVTVYHKNEGRCACEVQNSVLRYWIRCNPKEGVPALAEALKARQFTRCYTSTLSEVLLEHWVDEALPLVLAALKDENPEVVESAVSVLERHASADVIPHVIIAIGQLLQAPEDRIFAENPSLAGAQRDGRSSSMSQLLLKSKHWKLTKSQLEQLAEVMPEGKAKDAVRRQIETPKPTLDNGTK